MLHLSNAKDHNARPILMLVLVLAVLAGPSILLEYPRIQASSEPIAVSLLPQALPTPLALYHFDGDFTDSSGNGQDLAQDGSVSFTNGKFGQGAHVNNGSGILKRSSFIGFPTAGNPWTIAMWVKPTLLSGGNRLFVLSDPSGQWSVNLDAQNRLGVKAIGSSVRPPINQESFFSNVQVPDDGNFHHVVVRWTSVLAGGVTLTLDGIISESIQVPYEYWVSRFPLTLFLDSPDCSIDELVLVNGLLSDAQIAQLQTGTYDFLNVPPTAACRSVTVTTDSSCQAIITAGDINDGSSDPEDGGNVTLSLNSTGPFGLGLRTVTLTVTDTQGLTDTCTATVTVANPAPFVTITAPLSGAIFPVNTPVTFTGSFADNPGIHTAAWMFDSISQAGVVDESSGSVSTEYIFAAAGVYAVKLTVIDGCGGIGIADQVEGLDAMVVIYDPKDGFVTGGGWFNSPAGAYTLNPSLADRANFGFVSKYQKGATVPTGETEFQFQVANFNFHSTSYQWLVVSGARAQYKGFGTVNGTGNYGFMLTAIDGQVNGGGGADKLRIKIWDKNNGDAIVYDNQLGGSDSAEPAILLGGGSIVIHK